MREVYAVQRGKLLRLLAAFVLVTVCARRERCGGDNNEAAAEPRPTAATTGGTLVFGSAADPVALDGALVSDGESLRVIHQIFEGLVALKPGTTEVEPAARDELGRQTHDGKAWTFHLRQGVKFHDGTDFNADGRLLQLRPLVQLQGLVPERRARSYYWQIVFGGFKTYDRRAARLRTSLYKSCEATDDEHRDPEPHQAVGDDPPGAVASSRSRSPARRR